MERITILHTAEECGVLCVSFSSFYIAGIAFILNFLLSIAAGIAFILNAFVQCLLLYWKPDPTDVGMFFAISFIFGAATSTLEFYILSESIRIKS